MEHIIFHAYAVANEIDLNRIAVRCKIPKKYTWEEPLVLEATHLNGMTGLTLAADQRAMLFSYGSMVCINMTDAQERTFLDSLIREKDVPAVKDHRQYSDFYEIRIVPRGDVEETGEEAVSVLSEPYPELTDESITLPAVEPYHAELVSTVIAKSVAFERTEEQLERILDTLENLIDRLDRGRGSVGNREVARTISRIVRHEYNSIAYIMVLDKPDVTWQHQSVEAFYDRMAGFFELSDRYQVLKTKTDILHSIVDGVSDISNTRRGLMVEWIIVALIVVEVLLMVLDLLR